MNFMNPRPLVMATGVFDLLHAQHVALLEFARQQGSTLIVGINSDASVRRIKPGRPIINEFNRLRMLWSLRCVDDAMVFTEDTPLKLIQDIKPGILVKGHDYQDKPVPEAEILKEWGGRLVIAPTSDRESTTAIINRIRSGAP